MSTAAQHLERPLVQVFDLRGAMSPEKLVARGKARPHWRRDTDGVDAIVLHHGGSIFGLADAARERIAKGKKTPLGGLDLGKASAPLELARRGLTMPYHVIAGAIDGEPFAADIWTDEVYSWHGNGANRRSLGVAILGCFPRFESEWPEGYRGKPNTPIEEADLFAAAGIVAVRRAARRLATLDPPLLFTHSQFARKDRDPGEHAIRTVVAPLVAEGVVRVEPDFHEGSGAPWPAEWRQHLPA